MYVAVIASKNSLLKADHIATNTMGMAAYIKP